MVVDLVHATDYFYSGREDVKLEFENKLYFAAFDKPGLWRSDGTEAGTEMVPGTESLVMPNFVRRPEPFLAATDGQVFFWPRNGFFGMDLWRTDGTFFGTERVAELNPAPVAGCSLAGPMTVFDGALFFSADCGSDAGYELWRSDGTAPGTMRFDLNPGAAHSLPRHFTTIGDDEMYVAIPGGRWEDFVDRLIQVQRSNLTMGNYYQAQAAKFSAPK